MSNPGNAELSDVTLKQAEDRQVAILNNINLLQQQEKKLYSDLEASAASGGISSDQDAIVKKINELSTMRMTMFQELEAMYGSMQGRVAQSRIDLVDQMTVTGVMEQELNNAKKNMNLLSETKSNKMRMVEINTYYASKYHAQSEFMKLIIMVCAPLLILAICAKKGWIPKNIANGVMALIIVIGGFFVIRKAINISSRNNMNFDEFDWSWDPDANNLTVYEYDKQQLQGATQEIEDDVNSFAKNMGLGCIGSACCASGTKYDDEKQKCIEGFQNEGFQPSFVQVASGSCPFKPNTNVVKPYSDASSNFVKV
tara:strand:+ start:5977 stop:6912 length:936 start_codon:yes stop_codon:yes gene_type:complete